MIQNSNLNREIQGFKGVGERRAKLFRKLGIDTAGALLRHYPRSYLDTVTLYTIREAPEDIPCAVRAVLSDKSATTHLNGGRTIIRCKAYDQTGELSILYFNNHFVPDSLTVGEEYVFYGKYRRSLLARDVVNPIVIKRENTNRLEAQYPLTEGLSSRMISNAVRQALDLCAKELQETLPDSLLESFHLLSRRDAIETIHFPKDFTAAAAAKDRLIFEELLTLQLGLSLRRNCRKQSTSVYTDGTGAGRFLQSLSFKPTGAQRRCIKEILTDMASGIPMNRLLQGDVGSGKTMVAACAACCAALAGYQTAFMAPTEVLAEQHAKTLSGMLSPFHIKVGLLTGSIKGKARGELLDAVSTGECTLLIGTHALLSDSVQFSNLGLVVADEQHRFGVNQRSLLTSKGDHPHLLVMSATPIPRTLALIIYGDLDISIIDELPHGRKKIRTYLVDEGYRERYLNFARKVVAEGHQVYVVCPRIDDAQTPDDLASAVVYRQELEEKYLKGIPLGLIHGRMKSKEKTEIMRAFHNGDISVLVSTTVIEVGVDVPNASLMIIENAERFGLSALHQLRGRIGRGSVESQCILVSSSQTPATRARLEVLKDNSNGFEIAKFDLKSRGPGDFFGSRQHGLPELQIADLAQDEDVLTRSSDAAKKLLAEDPTLSSRQYEALRLSIEQLFHSSEGTLN